LADTVLGKCDTRLTVIQLIVHIIEAVLIHHFLIKK